MADCNNIIKPSDSGGSLTCGELETTLNEVEVMCAELNAISEGSVYFHDETPGSSPASPTTPATIPSTLVDGTIVLEFYDDFTNYWKYDLDLTTWTLAFQRATGGSGSGGAPVNTNLADNASVSVQWWGTSPPTFVEDIVGTYTMTIPAGTRLKSLTFTGGTGTLASSQLILNFVDVDGKSLHFSGPALINESGWQYVDLGLMGINPTQDASVAGTITSTWVNMTYTNFRIMLNFAA